MMWPRWDRDAMQLHMPPTCCACGACHKECCAAQLGREVAHVQPAAHEACLQARMVPQYT